MQRVIRDKSAPDETPESIDRLTGIATSDSLMQRIEKAGAGRLENRKNLFFALGERIGDGTLLREQRQFVREKQGDASVPFSNRINAGPRNLTRRNQRVEAR